MLFLLIFFLSHSQYYASLFFFLLTTELLFSEDREQCYVKLANNLLLSVYPWSSLIYVHTFAYLVTILTAWYSTACRNSWVFVWALGFQSLVLPGVVKHMDWSLCKVNEQRHLRSSSPDVWVTGSVKQSFTTISSMVRNISLWISFFVTCFIQNLFSGSSLTLTLASISQYKSCLEKTFCAVFVTLKSKWYDWAYKRLFEEQTSEWKLMYIHPDLSVVLGEQKAAEAVSSET